MDSGNSGSMQSSSGGDEEYDSRAESISAFLTSSSGTHVGASQPPPPPSFLHHHQSPSLFFDSLSNFLDPFSRPPPPTQNSSSLLNLDMVLPGSNNLRSEPASNCNNNNTSQHLIPSPLPSSSTQPPPISGPPHSLPGRVTTGQIPNNQPVGGGGRNPKKRSRASRRAPTTVLTTDTSNFRAMVQEFTGIPAPPFSASAFPRTRLDLFNTSSTVRSGHLDASAPSYLLRPFAQKLHPPPFLSSSSSIMDNTITSTTTKPTSITNNNTSTSTTNNYQLLSELGLPKQAHQNLLNIHNNPSLSYQSLLQSNPPPKYPSSTLPSSVDSRLKMGLLDDFSNENVVGTQLGGGTSADGGLSMRSDHHNSTYGDQNLLSSFNGNYSNSHQSRVNGCKQINYSGSLSDFNAEKGSSTTNEINGASKGEGMVDSWICSSD